MNSSSLRRLAADHAALHIADLPPYYLFPGNARSGMTDDLTQLNVLLAGPQGTPYSEGIWKLQLRIPQDYPKSPPKAFFRTKIWHPNVEESNGSVCLDTLKRDWQPKLTLRDILITISCLLINPNPDSALNSGAGKLLQEDWDEFTRYAKLMASVHARIPPSLREAAKIARGRGEEVANENGAESDEEEENTKENDPSLSPSHLESIPASIVQRPSILGKRPLGDLPTPPEPLSDDEYENYSYINSERNIAANTPNLSSNMACMGIAPAFGAAAPSRPDLAPTQGSRRPTKLVERSMGSNFASHPSSSTMQNLTTSTDEASSCWDISAQPSSKRVCSGEGKENQGELEQLAHVLPQQGKSTTPLSGLGVKAHAGSMPILRKGMASGVGNGNRPKARVGLRRL